MISGCQNIQVLDNIEGFLGYRVFSGVELHNYSVQPIVTFASLVRNHVACL